MLTVSSCLKDELPEREIGVDPSPWYSFSASWQETGKKIGAADWNTMPNGNLLHLWWETDTLNDINLGKYEYDPSKAGIEIDSKGYMQIKDDLLSFITVKAGGQLDTIATVQYLLSGDTSLVIRNKATIPVTEVRYRKIR